MSPSEVDHSRWPHVYRHGSERVLLMLHGTGSNENEIVGLADAIDPKASVISPRGRVSEHGATRWFRRHGEGVFDVDDVIARADELAGFVRWCVEHYGIGVQTESSPLTAIGFSNGANIALALGMLHPYTVTRTIAFSGMYPLGDRDTEGDLSESTFLLLNGREDPMAPAASVDHLETQLVRMRADVERHQRTGGHGIDTSEVEIAQSWMRR